MEYNLRKRITSCTITKELIGSIEEYIKIDLVKFLALSSDVSKDFSIEVLDRLGKEKYNSFSEYRPIGFDDNIKAIEIVYYCQEKFTTRISLEISFGISKTDSDLNIHLKGDNAKEKCYSIVSRIEDLIRPAKTNNRRFHSYWYVMIWIFPLYLFWFSPFFISKKLYAMFIIIPLLTTFLIVLAFSPHIIKPYCDFNTRKQRIIQQYFKFFYWGILGFVFFNLIFSSLFGKLFN